MVGQVNPLELAGETSKIAEVTMAALKRYIVYIGHVPHAYGQIHF